MRRRLVLGMALAGLLIQPAAAETIWKVHSVFPENRAEAVAFSAFAADVERSSEGEFQLNFFHGGSLGLKDVDLLRTLPAGAADMAMIFSDYLSRDAPILGQLFVNGSATTPEENAKVAPVLKDFLTSFFEDNGLHVVGFYRAPLNQLAMFCKGTHVRTLEELRSKKVRVWSKDLVDTFGALGVSAQIIPQADLYIAMQTGVIDCAAYSHTLALSISLQEVADSASYLFLQAAPPVAAVANRASWNALTPELQEVLVKAADRMWESSAAVAADFSMEEKAMATTTAAGVTLLEPFSEEDQLAFRNAAIEVWADSAQVIGPEAVALREKVIDAMGD